MPRIPALTVREGLADEQGRVFDAIKATRGSVPGMFALLLHQPALADPVQATGAYLRFRSPLDPQVKECVASTVAHLLGCQIEWSAHSALALKAGTPQAVVDSIAADRYEDLDGDIGLATAFARSLIREHEVPQALFDRARQRWGDVLMVDLVALVSYYSLACLFNNAFEVGR